ncbi:TetR/AcrR family transcriptional regulator [Amycolatopsis benzoatilytica]|uniref:TetR/AcrR family transcriptional regulator n=1 Tax=Amycolatopsis benzoatilytica TaxID=346045 RepID=UPI0004817F1B|nr:TetR/AcrR family transcriptional regulator [Amycolatopsis benzoatilytica]
MPRPRIHDPELILDTAERLLADVGPEALTVRRLAQEAGVPNSSIYHAFTSLPALVGRTWLRAATFFLDEQERLADAAPDPIEAVVAAADTSAVVAEARPDAARMMVAIPSRRVLGPQLPDDLVESLHALDKRLVRLLVRLARQLWDRGDGPAVEVVTACVVDLPTALLRRELATGPASQHARDRLAAAVRGVLALNPPPPPRRKD